MSAITLNKKLLETFPELKNEFQKQMSIIDGLATGSTVVLEDIFMPFVVKTFNSRDEQSIIKIFNFIEKCASSDDSYDKDAIGVAVIDNLLSYDFPFDIEKYMGPCTLKSYLESKNWKLE